MSSSTQPRTANRISAFELAFLIAIIGVTLSLLLPSLANSRENARANLCRRNLRRLDLATADFVLHQRRLPDSVTWPVDLLPNLEENAGSDKSKFGQDVFSVPRPGLLTCPSHMNLSNGAETLETSHYVLIVDRNKRPLAADLVWSFRDREVRPPADKLQPWCVGVELTPAEAVQQLGTAAGPHADSSFNESDAHGNTRVVGAIE